MNNDYKQVYKNTGTVPRTTDEAYNTANYAYPIQRFKSEYDDFKDFMIGMFIWLVIAGMAFAMFYGFYVWLS